MKDINDIIARFDSISNLPVSEEFLGAYVEGKLDISNAKKVEISFSDFVGIEDILASMRDYLAQDVIDVNTINIFESMPSIGIDVLTGLNLAFDAVDMDESLVDEKIISADSDIKSGQMHSFLIDNNKMQAGMKEYKTFGYEPNKAENKYDPLIDQGPRPSCAIRSQEIILRDYGIAIPQEELIEFAVQQGWYSNDPEYGGTPRDAVGNLLEACDIPTMRTENATIYDIIAELRFGHRVIVSVDAEELWVKQEPTLYKRLFGEFKNKVQDAMDTLNGVQGANHALIVAGVTVNPKDPSDMHVTLIDSGSGDVCIEYSLKDFQNALEDSNSYMVSTTIPAPYQYNYETHEMEPSSFNTNYFPSMATLPVGISNEFRLDDSFYEKYADYESIYDVIDAPHNDSEQEVHSGCDILVQQDDDPSDSNVSVAFYKDNDDPLAGDNGNMWDYDGGDDKESDHKTLLDESDSNDDYSEMSNNDNPSNEGDYE